MTRARRLDDHLAAAARGQPAPAFRIIPRDMTPDELRRFEENELHETDTVPSKGPASESEQVPDQPTSTGVPVPPNPD